MKARTHTRLAWLATLLLLSFSGTATAAIALLFNDDFEDRVQDQAVIGNNWTWYELGFVGNTCEGPTAYTFGPPDGQAYDADNRNYWTASADFGQGDSYYRAGLEVPAWGGALSNMLRVYGNRYAAHPNCVRNLIFQETTLGASADYDFAFDVAKDQYGAPANGEITGAFIQILKQSDGSYTQLMYQSIDSNPPAEDATLASRQISFEVPQDMVGELLQFGFFSDVVNELGQSWATSGAYYDNVTLTYSTPPPPPPPPPPPESNYEGVPAMDQWGLVLLLVLVGGIGVIALTRRSN